MTSKWQTLLDTSPIILADGAMGTMLQAAGLAPGESPVIWNIEQPDRVRAVHRAYLEAGAQILITNTFVGSRFRLARHGWAARVAEVNRRGAELLREEIARAGVNALAAGDIGPSGELLTPLGALSFDDAVAGFEEQARALIEGGVDVIWAMTLADLEEARAIIEGVRRVSHDIPILVSMTFDTRGRTMMGVKPEDAARKLIEWGAAAIGGNCGNGPAEILEAIQKMRAVAPHAILIAKPNAGKPEIVEGKTIFPATPQVMAESAVALRDAGARIIGGCCGTTPAHIRAMRAALGL
ncbi:MAG: homocysteine S-methyltransferase family protein [Anaerolineae bacterium]|nr:homocysteine S-methyltransferase family protein [Anaerolineae bacterium]